MLSPFLGLLENLRRYCEPMKYSLITHEGAFLQMDVEHLSM